jgi:hypothetical protein
VNEIALAIVLAIGVPWGNPQMAQTTSVRAEEHIQKIIKDLPPDSSLRRALAEGARGNGVHHAWMDEMREKGVKRVLVGVDITFDRRGRPKQMKVSSTQYFSNYEGADQISDPDQLNAIRASGLEKQLYDLALQEAAHGYWHDVLRPKPNPFVGGTQIQFLDDEWLPGLPTIYTLFRPGK